MMLDKSYGTFFEEIKQRIYKSRYQAALHVNKELIFLYHHIGSKIIGSRSTQGWGAKVIDQLSKDLKNEFPKIKGFGPQNLKYMRKFAETYHAEEIGQHTIDQLP